MRANHANSNGTGLACARVMKPSVAFLGSALSFVAIAAVACGGGVASDNRADGGGSPSTPSSPSDGGPRSTPTTIPTLRAPKLHRPAAVVCDDVRPTAEPIGIPDAGIQPNPFATCTKNAECTSGANGRCTGNSHDGWACSYDECRSDDQCGQNVCECEGAFHNDANRCLKTGNCRLDSDCGAGGFCSPTLGDCGNYEKYVGYFCHTAKDECVDDADCDGGYCAYNQPAGMWKCSYNQCAG